MVSLLTLGSAVVSAGQLLGSAGQLLCQVFGQLIRCSNQLVSCCIRREISCSAVISDFRSAVYLGSAVGSVVYLNMCLVTWCISSVLGISHMSINGAH